MNDRMREKRKFMMTSVLDKKIDHLLYNSNSLDTSNKYLEEYRQWVVETRQADGEVMEKIIAQIDILGTKFRKVGPEMDEDLIETLGWLFRKIGWKPRKVAPNVGYASYEDMLLRYSDLKKELDNMKTINKQVARVFPRVVQEYQHMCQMNDKLDEIRFRFKLNDVSKAVSARATSKNDPLSHVFTLPLVLVPIVYDTETENSFASKLLNILKRLLVISEAIQYQRNPKNLPIVTMSNILEHPPQCVKSLYASIQLAEGNGEVQAPEEKILPIARDSAHTLIASENGETIAASEISLPIAKDSATTLGSNESPKPMSQPTAVAGQNASAINSHKNG
ncbi:hypothetical protein CAEBREN_12623 [Caenorhabditis brenneri]|uniref:Uncharacterized protein n=1 Tax=Caenorhabditis brenneri TaxID=135651 RepID=G0N725_CAEBE|nr:hypothetical protein CAEBREN_12623 [Caenorhabditis brenneri]